MKKIFLSYFLFCFFWSIEGRGENYLIKMVTASQVSSLPVIDGKIKEDTWLEAVRNGNIIAGFVSQGGGKIANCQMLGLVVYDNKNLYLGVLVYPSSMEKLTQKACQDDDKNIWSDDHLEVFIQPDINSQVYYQFAVNPENLKSSHYGDETPFFETATYKGNNSWSAEMVIPWSLLNITPEKGKVLGFNLAGAHTTADSFEWITWTKTSNFHDIKRFGRLILK